MFIYSVKASSIKFFSIIFAAVLILAVLVIFVPTYGSSANTGKIGNIKYDDIKTNEDRVNFLKQFGWTVNDDAVEVEKVTIPSEFDKIFVNYNEIQKLQGLDLSKYKRKTLTRYTYEITNYPDYDGKVLATILVYRNRIVGGDICSADGTGFVFGFEGK